MKHTQLLPLLLCVALSYPSHAQYFERNFQVDFYNQVAELRSGPGGEMYFTSKNPEQTSFKPIIMHRVDEDGNTVAFPMLGYGQSIDYDWIPFAGGFIATAYFFECDIFLWRRIFRYDSSGWLLWEKGGEEDIIFPPLGQARLLPGPGDSFWLFYGDKPVLYNGEGDSIGVAPLALPMFEGYLPESNGDYLTYGNGLTRYSPDLSSIETGLQGTLVLKVAAMDDGRYAVLTENQILIVDADFAIEQSTNYSINEQVDMAANNTGVWLLAHTTPKQLLRYDTALTLQQTQIIPADATFQPAFITADTKRIALAGEEYGTFATQVVGIRSTAPDAVSFDATADAAVADITSPQPPVVYSYPGFHLIKFDSVTVTVKNEGADTLRSVALNAQLGYDFFICQVIYSYQQSFSGLNLPPGESAQLEVGEIIQFGTFIVPSVTNLCFWTTLPNDSLDLDRWNNRFCKTFNVIVDEDEPQQITDLSVAPNPATDAFIVQWSDDAASVAYAQLYDAMGRKVNDTRVTGGQWTFYRENLPSGLYQIILTDGKGKVYAGKIVLE